MNSKKKQTVAVAMATALGASAMMSPVAVHALEEDPATAITQESNQQDSTQEAKPQDDTPVSEQGLPASEQPQGQSTNSLSLGKPIIQSRANVAFTDYDEAQQAIETALADYPVSNATTQQEILDFLKREFVATGKLGGIRVMLDNITLAAPDSTGTIEISVILIPVVPGLQFPLNQGFTSSLIIPRIPKNGEVAINKANFPDDTFRKYVKDNLDRDNPKDGVLSQDEINNITEIDVSVYTDITSLQGIEYFTALTSLICEYTGINSLDVSKNLNLTTLICNNTGIDDLNVTQNTALTFLNCSNTSIDSLIVRNNPKLMNLYCFNIKIKDLNVSDNPDLMYLYCSDIKIDSLNVSKNTALQTLSCSNIGITKLDISNNLSLSTLYCNNTDIKELNVSNNSNLLYLYCQKTDIGSLDVSNNSVLQELNCSNTKIKVLNVSNNTDLTNLDCSNTGIQTLDVSNIPYLRELDCSNTPLAWLNLGNQIYLNDLNISASLVDLAVTSDSFDMTQAFQGIDISKVTNITGATLNGNSITGYTLGKPITYTYDCGTVNGNPITLDVTLNLVKSDSDIQITGILDTTYTGKPINKPSVISTGSKGTVTITYEKWNGSAWEMVNDMPTNAGRYRIQAHLAESDFYKSAEAIKEFSILQAINRWKNEPAIADWTYSGQPSTPTATAKFGNPIFTYSDSKTGAFSSDVPTNAGTWYVKATVPGTNNYTGLESIRAFSILPKDIKHENITVSDINSDNDVKKLSVKDGDGDRELVKGTDYDVETKKIGNKITVTIIFKGNYAGTIERSYSVTEIAEPEIPEKPEQKPQQDKPQEKPKDTDSVKTGDTTQTGLFATLGVLSAGCIALLAGKKRKKNMKEDEITQ